MLGTASVASTPQIQADAYSASSGATTGSDGSLVAAAGDWVQYSNVNFGSGATALQMQLAAAEQSGLKIQLRVDSVKGQVIGTVKPPSAKSKSQVQTIRIRKTAGVHNLYLVFVGSKGQVNLNWLKLSTPQKKK